MRRWNGWGKENFEYNLEDSAFDYIAEKVGKGNVLRDVELKDVIKKVPESRLSKHNLILTDAKERVTHSSGQSFADWVMFKGGEYDQFTDGVSYPENEDEVKQIIKFAKENKVSLIPYGGGTSVTGHLSPEKSKTANLTVDMSRMNRMLSINKENFTAVFEAGIKGPDLEAALRAEGFTLGHYPQSFEYASLGGWVAARSAGHFSMGYGRIERLLQACQIETPKGSYKLLEFPASAAGPDIKELILGSEGRLGIITKCTVRIIPLPKKEIFKGAFFKDEKSAKKAVREISQNGISLTMMRLSYEKETANMLALNGESLSLTLLNKYLKFRGFSINKSMLLYGIVGNKSTTKSVLKRADRIIKKYGGIIVGETPGKHWHKKRFDLPYLRNTLWDKGYGIDTLETAIPWDMVDMTISDVEKSITNSFETIGEKVSIFTHLSHIYKTGSSIYTSYIFELGKSHKETLDKWLKVKEAVSKAIVKNKGTISHQHGIGKDHLPFLEAEKGSLGIKTIENILKTFDPDGIMNPGKLVK